MGEIDERASKLLATTRTLLGKSMSMAGGGSYERPPALRLVQEGVEKNVGVGNASEAEDSNALPSNDDINTLFTMNGALVPPYDPEVLVILFEHSNSLRPNVDAYATNIDGFGLQLVPVVDPDSDKASEKVGDAIFLERMRESEDRGMGAPQAAYPSPEEIAARLGEIRQLMRLEHAQLSNFFAFCCADRSFTELRENTRTDVESTGNGYWEVLRDGEGRIAQFVYCPSYSMRLAPIEHHLTEVQVNHKVSSFQYKSVPQRRRFRRFMQVVLDRVVWFKEFGDTRVISRRTGQVWSNEETLREADSSDAPATEILHFRIHSPRSPYGVPRWIGTLLSVLGSRSAEEVNYLYFDNKAVPPLAVLVSGGALTEGAVTRIENYVRDNIKGRENFHRILVIEAEATAGRDNGRTRIVLQPLREAQQQDALFQEYDERNIDKVGSSFRMPRLLRGDVRDFNRATADAALAFAEMQVFQPEREKTDGILNRRILSDLGIRFWTVKSNSPVNRDPAVLTEILTKLGTAGSLTPEEIREFAADVLNKELKKIDADWLRQPMPMTLAGIISTPGGATQTTPGAETAGPAPAAPGEKAAPLTEADRAITVLSGKIVALREAVTAQARKSWTQEDIRKAVEENEATVIKVSAEQMADWVNASPD